MLTKSDYISILNYYNLPIPKSTQKLKKEAEKILSYKLCRCIKKVSPKNEPKSIGICTESIFNRKGLTRGSFKCNKGRFVKFNKTKKNKK